VAALYLVRHGQASFGTHDYDRLSSCGVRQAQEAGRYLAAAAGRAVRIVSGSLVRQRDTAAEIAHRVSTTQVEVVPIHIDERFDEVDLDSQIAQLVPSLQDADGTLATLLTEARTSSRSYQKLVKRVFLHWQSLPEPLDSLESWPVFASRIAAALEDLIRASRPGESTVVVTSGGVIAALVRQVLALPEQSVYPLFEVMMNCSITCLLHDRQRMSLSSFNECSYLTRSQGEASTELLTYR
jgi:broad specificity phosphatase PhoE